MKFRKFDSETIVVEDGKSIRECSCKCTNETYFHFDIEKDANIAMSLLEEIS